MLWAISITVVLGAFVTYKNDNTNTLTILDQINSDKEVLDDVLFIGAEAVGLGAIYGGSNFVCSYPSL